MRPWFLAADQLGRPSVGLVTVVNGSQSPASLNWQESGFLGRSGTHPIEACRIFAEGFGPGEVQLMLTTASTTSTFTLRAPQGSHTELVLIVGRDGSVKESSALATPEPACGPGSLQPTS